MWSWFSSVLINTFSFPDVVRVWDVLFVAGSETLVEVALLMLQTNAQFLTKIEDPELLVQEFGKIGERVSVKYCEILFRSLYRAEASFLL
jgi:hypothetical protein